MTPTLEQYKTGQTTWRGEHKGVNYSISHWGIGPHQPTGIWNYYLHLDEHAFMSEEDFAKWDRTPTYNDFAGRTYQSYDYYSCPDINWHGGPTFYEISSVHDRRTNKFRKVIKMGCDYNHSFDRDNGYHYDLESVRRDCIATIEQFLLVSPQKTRCGYSGVLDVPENFYRCKNGRMVHISREAEATHSWVREEEPKS